ncbi:MAG TPA: DotU family type IV/VI secretion system protein [Paraburkholderia sp.]
MTTPLRELLRDTVLHVALVAAGAEVPALHCWRARCITLVDELTQAMRDAGYGDALIDQVGFAQCVLLDEVTLRSLPAERRNEWSRELLQARYHDEAHTVDTVWAMIERAAAGSDHARIRASCNGCSSSRRRANGPATTGSRRDAGAGVRCGRRSCCRWPRQRCGSPPAHTSIAR